MTIACWNCNGMTWYAPRSLAKVVNGDDIILIFEIDDSPKCAINYTNGYFCWSNFHQMFGIFLPWGVS